MNNTRNDESPGHPHQCSVCQTAGHATLDNGVESKSWAQSNRTTNCRAVQCVLIFMARTVQQSEQQAAAKSAAKATMEALKSCCIQLGAVQCTHTEAAGHKDSPTHPHTHTLSTCVTRVWISALVHHPLHMGKWNPRFAPKPLVRKPSLMELPSPPAGQHFVCVLCPVSPSQFPTQDTDSRIQSPVSSCTGLGHRKLDTRCDLIANFSDIFAHFCRSHRVFFQLFSSLRFFLPFVLPFCSLSIFTLLTNCSFKCSSRRFIAEV